MNKTDGLLWRQKGKAAGFAAVCWPYGKGETGEVYIDPLEVTDANGQPVGLDQGQAVKIRALEGAFTVLVNYGGQPLDAGGLRAEDRVAVKPVE